MPPTLGPVARLLRTLAPSKVAKVRSNASERTGTNARRLTHGA
jgi:hypothetical protein